jgi:hypothetical protein
MELQPISKVGAKEGAWDASIDPVQYHTHDGIDSPNIPVSRVLQCIVFGPTQTISTGDGKLYIHIDPRLDGKRLVDIHALVITAGTTNTTDIQIANVTKGFDMLATKLTIDSAETGSETATTPVIINTTNSVSLNDVLRIDVDAVSTTPPQGLVITLGFN